MPNYYDFEAKMGTVTKADYPEGVFDYRLKIKVYVSKKEDFGHYFIAAMDEENEVKIAVTLKKNKKPDGDRWVKVDALIKNVQLLKPGAIKGSVVKHTDAQLNSSKVVLTFMNGNMPISQTKKFNFR